MIWNDITDKFLADETPWRHRPFQYWRWPGGYLGWLAVALVGVLLAGVIVLVYMTGGTKLVYAHAAYVPVVLGGFLFGIPGGIATGAVAGIGVGPWMPLDVAAGIPQSRFNWLYRTGFLTAIGALSGGLCAALGYQLDTVRRQAYLDRLTGLPNRVYLLETLSRALVRGWAGSLLILRLRQYHEVLAWLGQDHAEQLQRAAARRLRDGLPPDRMLYDLGDGLFGLALEQDDPDTAERLARRLIDLLDEPLSLGEIPVLVEGRIGIVHAARDTADSLSLLRKATAALAQAETAGRSVAVYDDGQDHRHRQRINLLPALREALKRDDQLRLYYQPKIELGTGRCRSVEALARWHHPQHGPMLPALFIPLAENTQLITPFTDWVIASALQDLSDWGRDDLMMAVNASVRNLEDETFPERVEELLARYRIDGERLELEITESALIAELDTVLYGLKQLRRLGVRIALDDFGTGLSSLTYLKDLPIDVLKLDRTFLAGLATDSRVGMIVTGTIEIAHSLDFEVVAEGIEDAATCEWLRTQGCDLGQGYFIARPMPADAFTAWLKNEKGIPDKHLRSA